MTPRLPSLEAFRQRLAYFDALPQLVILGVLSGLATGGVILLFRLAIEWPQHWLLPTGISEQFESLAPWQRLAFPISGSVLLILMFWALPDTRRLGIPHLLERLNYHQGRLAAHSLLGQFVGAAVALSSGHSVGREGPAVYLGGVCSSLLGQWLNLPNNTLRLLVACGSAAAIAAVFNTPLAGVIFAMEVILLEYSIIGFIPIIVAAVVADVLVQMVLGHATELTLPGIPSQILAELPLLLVLGLVTGLLAALFIFVLQQSLRLRQSPFALRLLGAGVLTGLIAWYLPEVMGTGYDSIETLFDTPPALGLLLVLLLTKTLLTPAVIGLGVPGGLIGPSLVIGGLCGALLAYSGQAIGVQLSVPLFTIIGMGAMMGAVLNAPLAALVALLELTNNSAVILPGMLAIVVSNLTLRSLFRQPSAFQAILTVQGLDQRQAPLAQTLSRAAIGSLMQRDFIVTPPQLSREQAEALLARQPRWLLIEHPERPTLLPPGDLISWLHSEQGLAAEQVDLLQIPAARKDAHSLIYRATLLEAWQLMERQHTDVLLVLSNREQPLGIISRRQIEEYYNFKQAL